MRIFVRIFDEISQAEEYIFINDESKNYFDMIIFKIRVTPSQAWDVFES